jgi:hypothetical protein
MSTHKCRIATGSIEDGLICNCLRPLPHDAGDTGGEYYSRDPVFEGKTIKLRLKL